MKRFIIIPALLALGLVLPATTQAQTLRALEARVSTVEERLTKIEEQLSGKKAGETAVVRTEDSGPAQPAAQPTKEADQTYVIRDGDSLGGIARKFSVPRQALLKANNMAEGQPIYIGETLVIPAQPETESAPVAAGLETHVVRAGDTLMGISRQYKTSVDSIKLANGLSSDVIGVGTKLVIPSKNAPAPSQAATENPAPKEGKYQYDNPLLDSNETYGYYTIEKGDNLYALARDFFTTMAEIQRLNKMGKNTTIFPGKELIVPTTKYNEYHNNVAQN